jgi:hypothetical protein
MLPPPDKTELDGAARPRDALTYGDGLSESSTYHGRSAGRRWVRDLVGR